VLCAMLSLVYRRGSLPVAPRPITST
jgi:hypothetical protein